MDHGRNGRVAIVAGGATGIGLATVRRLLDDGWRVAVLDADEDAVDAAVDAMAADAGERLFGEPADLTDDVVVERAIDRVVAEWGAPAGLVNAVAAGPELAFEATDVSMLRKALEDGLVSAFVVAQAAAGRMAEGGAIVNVVPAAALRGLPGGAVLSAAGGGLAALTRTLAVELAPMAIRVNAVALAAVETPQIQRRHDAATRTRWLAAVPQRRYGLPEEAAAVIAFLLSEEAGFVTGTILPVDGGLTAAVLSTGPMR
jgi:NAD(P)-dependent dehydrogenase (short-subunit alcohol dehydrogenase family)